MNRPCHRLGQDLGCVPRASGDEPNWLLRLPIGNPVFPAPAGMNRYRVKPQPDI